MQTGLPPLEAGSEWAHNPGNYRGNCIAHSSATARLPQWKDNGRTSCPRVIEITLGVEFAKMNELTGTITLSSGVQARILDKSLVDSLEGTVV